VKKSNIIDKVTIIDEKLSGKEAEEANKSNEDAKNIFKIHLKGQESILKYQKELLKKKKRKDLAEFNPERVDSEIKKIVEQLEKYPIDFKQLNFMLKNSNYWKKKYNLLKDSILKHILKKCLNN